jgi:hypothetical protein
LKEILEVREFIIYNSEFIILDFINGGLAQLARALALHARGHRFDSDILHQAMPGDNLIYL